MPHSLFRIAFFLLLFLIVGQNSAEAQTFQTLDYSEESNWAALPWTKDAADGVPSKDFNDLQKDAQVDVFFIHPTSYINGGDWNADMTKKSIIKRTDSGTIKHQASVFNGSCKIYAPRYQQAVLRSFVRREKGGQDALDKAYEDVKSAFEYYLKHYNKNRPIIIASHSQGTEHAARLLKEFFDDKPLKSKLVVAYLIGMPVDSTMFQNLTACKSAQQTSCICSWSTYQGNKKPHKVLRPRFASSIAVNPITWTTDFNWSEPKAHRGVCMGNYKVKYQESVTARNYNGHLQITKPDVPFKILLTKRNWHIADYNLFWVNIRENVDYRIGLFWKQ